MCVWLKQHDKLSCVIFMHTHSRLYEKMFKPHILLIFKLQSSFYGFRPNFFSRFLSVTLFS